MVQFVQRMKAWWNPCPLQTLHLHHRRQLQHLQFQALQWQRKMFANRPARLRHTSQRLRPTLARLYLGVDEVGIAASARSMCFFCKNRIEKGTVRFSLHHNTKRPPAWVHSMCLPSLLCQEGSLMGPSKQRLEHLKNSGTLDHGLREAVSSALSAMPSG